MKADRIGVSIMVLPSSTKRAAGCRAPALRAALAAVVFGAVTLCVAGQASAHRSPFDCTTNGSAATIDIVGGGATGLMAE